MSAFIFTEEPITAWREVQVTVPTDEGFTTQTMRMLMVACSKEELVVLAEAEAEAVFGPRDERESESDERKDPVMEFLVPRIQDWQGVARAAGADKTTQVSFSEANLRTLLAIPYVQTAVVGAYTTFVRGGKGEKDARRKNY